MSIEFLINVAIAGVIWWLAVYILSNNIRSKIAWISFSFLFGLSVFLLAVSITRNITSYDQVESLWHAVEWSYLLPIALIFHFSVITTRSEKNTLNKITLTILYTSIAILYVLTNQTNLVIDYSSTSYIDNIGYVNPRGPLFWLITPIILLSTIGSIINYRRKLKNINKSNNNDRKKFSLAIISSSLYTIAGPLVVYLYYDPQQILAVRFGPALLILPFIPMLIAILFYKLISDIDYIFNWKEFSYLSLVMLFINILMISIFITYITPVIGELAFILIPAFILITIFTHGFYNWLITFIRDLLYNAKRGFSLITDADVIDLVKNFHTPEKLETNALLKFKAVKQNTKNGKLVDSAQDLTREALKYFKQKDFPRRNKQNLKYQLLKMLTQDSAEEGQILWELGFEGYPMKIMAGEDSTRKPIFSIESMSDYTATSRNAFIALKKEAIHDLAWRLSYIEKTTKY